MPRLDSIVFKVTNEKLKIRDTFTVKRRKVAFDSMAINPNQRGQLSLIEPFRILVNTPIARLDTTRITLMDKDSAAVAFTATLDSLANEVDFAFEVAPEQKYGLSLLPGTLTDFFGQGNDTLSYTLSTKGLAEYGNLALKLEGAIAYPIIVQLTDEKGETMQEIKAEEGRSFEFKALDPGDYTVRVIFDANGNGIWDTGSYLKKLQPERISYFPGTIEIRANWEKIETFRLLD